MNRTPTRFRNLVPCGAFFIQSPHRDWLAGGPKRIKRSQRRTETVLHDDTLALPFVVLSSAIQGTVKNYAKKKKQPGTKNTVPRSEIPPLYFTGGDISVPHFGFLIRKEAGPGMRLVRYGWIFPDCARPIGACGLANSGRDCRQSGQ